MRTKLDLSEGWIFRECPRTSRQLWRRMLEVFGAENYYILSIDYLRDFHVRGQLMIAPEALARLRARLAELPPMSQQTLPSSPHEVIPVA